MKNKGWIAVVAALALALTLAGCAGNPGAPVPSQITVYTQNAADRNTVSVSATGEIKVAPDIAYITAGVVTRSEEAVQAQRDNSEAMNTLFDALKSAGLTEDDIETTGYSVNPVYNYNYDTGESKIYAYEVTNTVRITVRDLGKAGEIIDIAGSSGANTSFSITFTLEDSNAHYNEALAKAMEEARGKADTLAKAGGFTIIRVLTVSEGSYSYYPVNQYAAADEAGTYRETPISSGDLTVTASVTVVYEIG